MTPEQFKAKCDAYEINSEIYRTRIRAFIGLVLSIGVLGLILWTATVAEKHYAHQALVNQEQVAWK
jgi:hypothetical protein